METPALKTRSCKDSRQNPRRLATLSLLVSFFAAASPFLNAAIAQSRTFTTETPVLLGAKSNLTASLFFGDLDGDGDQDLVVANGRHWAQDNEIFLNRGDGTFLPGSFPKTSPDPSYATPLADLDGDGDLDIAVGNDRVRKMIFLNNGKGKFLAHGSFSDEKENTRNLTLADLNFDGHVDILIANRQEPNKICFNDGTGKFPRTRSFGSRKGSTISIAVADLNGDLRPDLVLGNRGGQPNEVFLNDEQNTFSESTVFGRGRDNTRSVAIADMNGDNHLDIVTGNIGQSNGIYFGDGKGSFDSGMEFGGKDNRTYSVAVSDLDQDGDIDIVVGNVGSQNTIFFNRGNGRSFAEARFGAPDSATYGIALADADGDGFEDIGVANSGSQNAIYFNRPAPFFPLIPRPHHLVHRGGEFLINSRTKILVNDPSLLTWELDRRISEVLACVPRKINSTGVHSDSVPPPNTILLSLSDDDQIKKLGSEGYRINVRKEHIKLTASAPSGIFYAIQTLRQILPDVADDPAGQSETLSVPCCTLEDSPRFPWRGQLLDVSRHFLPLEVVRRNIDELACLKMNVFHWHLTDDQGWRIEVKQYPKLTEVGGFRVDRNQETWWGREPQKPGEKATYGGFYSQDEIGEIIDYASKRFITIVPEVDIPGHSRSAIAAHPEISCDGGPYFVATGGIMSHNTYCPGKEITFRFIEDVLTEVINLFPSKYIHIGGDECNKDAWKNCADCQNRKKAEGLSTELELQSYFIRRVEDILNKKGRILLGWDEILEGGLAPNAAVMSWRGTNGGITAAKAGHEVIMTPHQFCYLDLKQGDPELEPPLGYGQCRLRTVYGHDPIPAELTQEESKLVLGIQGNLWGESIQNEENVHYMLFPRLYAIAEVAWSSVSNRDWREFIQRLEPHLNRMRSRKIGYARSLYNVNLITSPYEKETGIEVRLETEHGAVPIHYTTDGSSPTHSSPLYVDPFRLTGSRSIQAGSFREKSLLGPITKRDVSIHKAAGKTVQFKTKWSEKYTGGKEDGLTDCRRGSLIFADGNWMGFEGDDLLIQIDLGDLISVKQVSVSCLETHKSWIFLPTELEVLLSTDGINFNVAARKKHDSHLQQREPRKKTFDLAFSPAQARHIKVRAKSLSKCPDWHPGKGKKCWLFVDEILVD